MGARRSSGHRRSDPTIPFHRPFTRQDESAARRRPLIFPPRTLDVGGTLEPEIRYRGIDQAVLDDAKLVVSALFVRPDFADLDGEAREWPRGTAPPCPSASAT